MASVLRPGGRLAIVDGAQYNDATAPPQRENARTSSEYAAIGDQLPFYGGRPQGEIEALLRAHGLVNVAGDPLTDLISAQTARLVAKAASRGAPALCRVGRRPPLKEKTMNYEHILVDIEDGVGIVTPEPAREAERDEPAARQRAAGCGEAAGRG